MMLKMLHYFINNKYIIILFFLTIILLIIHLLLFYFFTYYYFVNNTFDYYPNLENIFCINLHFIYAEFAKKFVKNGINCLGPHLAMIVKKKLCPLFLCVCACLCVHKFQSNANSDIPL